MNIAALLEDLRVDEGWNPSPYRDSENLLTIGYGFLIDESRDVHLPKEVGDFWLEHEAQSKWLELLQAEPWLSQQPDDVQRAIGNMAYQLGVSGVLKFQKMLDALKAGNRLLAANEALDSQWARQTPQRARRVADLIRGA